ncbi:hypothetical protein FAF44_36155 [Nonomuraea sp. MG754425]|uniref:hypothetical protein n=1 Tax=Nonomuraea sp. MG754425 TaxID=2570319 RepID=UPI001F1FEAE9|nr:hypothetical protein [Nonomuraea sp. MG754425]MCF6473779.1 hypothetical protein [Nonomuraea sp. MG754425]
MPDCSPTPNPGAADERAHDPKEADYVGSNVGTPDELTRLLALIDDGQVVPTIEPIAFTDIGAGLTRLAAGQVTGRLVAVL